MFDAAYTRALIDIGYRDANERIDEIEAFLHAAYEATDLASRARDARNKARYETGDPIHVVDARGPASGVRT